MVVNGSDLLAANPIKNMEGGKQRLHGVSYGLGEAGYDIRLKQGIRFSFTKHGCEVKLDKGLIYPGRFCIASAIEEFDVPTNLVGVVHDKSTWARKGLSVFNTVIEPGFRGGLTLELVYHGYENLYIPAGAGIAQVIFTTLSSTASYSGKYQNQSSEPVHAIFE